MKTVDLYRDSDITSEFNAFSLYPTGSAKATEQVIPVEHTVEILLNTVPTMRIICTPEHIIDLIMGRLFTEGIIHSKEDIEHIYLCDKGTRAHVFLSEKKANFSKKCVETIPSCCTGNQIYNSYFTNDSVVNNVVPIPWEGSWIFAAAKAFAGDSPLHKRTFGTHSCYLMSEGTIRYCREDLGRHNAFDKVIGAALKDGVDLCHCLIFSSGRLPVDMVMKAIRAGVPILVSKAVPTDETVRLARNFKLTLVCSARPDKAVVYNDPLHCVCTSTSA